MSRETQKYLYDIASAAELVMSFTTGQRFSDYRENAMLRSAVERQLEIIGEALNQLSRRSPDATDRIRGYRRAISFRNILIRGYASVDDEIVWRVIQDDLPLLQEDVRHLQDSETPG